MILRSAGVSEGSPAATPRSPKCVNCPPQALRSSSRTIKADDLQAKAKTLAKARFSTHVSPGTLLAWHRRLIAHAHTAQNHQGLDDRFLQANFAPFGEGALTRLRSRVVGQLNDDPSGDLMKSGHLGFQTVRRHSMARAFHQPLDELLRKRWDRRRFGKVEFHKNRLLRDDLQID